MSRIYEALRRAELEQGSSPFEHISRDIGASGAEGMNDKAPNTPVVELRPSQQQSWTPLVPYLPAIQDRGECVEQFRGLRSQLYLQRLQANLKTILINSGMAGEGKTFVTANLAMSLARNKEGKVLLIDADLRRSSLHSVLGAPRSPGLSEYLRGSAELAQVMQRPTETADHKPYQHVLVNITFIAAGDGSDDAVELISNRRIEELIARVTPHFDWIIIDAPPVLAVTDAVDIARAADAVLLVARQAKTPYDVAQRAYEAFKNSRVLGFVINAVKDAAKTSYYHAYYHDDREKRGDSRQGIQEGVR